MITGVRSRANGQVDVVAAGHVPTDDEAPSLARFDVNPVLMLHGEHAIGRLFFRPRRREWRRDVATDVV
jgi:hypothetical protein